MTTSTADAHVSSVLYADDHELMRSAVGNLIGSHPELHLAAVASNGAELTDTYRELCEAGERPDLVVTDLAMPVIDGVEACRRITGYDSDATIVVLSAYDDTSRVSAALDAGASSYLLKSSSADALVSSIVACANGRVVLNSAAMAGLAEALRDEPRDTGGGLTDRQIEVLRLAEIGRSRAEIGAELYISANTVKHHLACIYERLGVSNVREAAHRARQEGLL